MMIEHAKASLKTAIEAAKQTAKDNGHQFAYVSNEPKISPDAGNSIDGYKVDMSWNYFTSDEDFNRIGFTQYDLNAGLQHIKFYQAGFGGFTAVEQPCGRWTCSLTGECELMLVKSPDGLYPISHILELEKTFLKHKPRKHKNA